MQPQNIFPRARPRFTRFSITSPVWHFGQAIPIFFTSFCNDLVFLHSGNPEQARNFPKRLNFTAIGRPLVENASVAAHVVRQTRGEKLINFKYRPKARRRVKKGHRQELTVLRISDIVLGGKSAAADAAKAAEAKLTERQRLEEVARRQAEADAALAAKLKPAAPKAQVAPRATKATKTAPAAEAATKTTKPRVARASAAEGDAPAEKPKRARAAKKDE